MNSNNEQHPDVTALLDYRQYRQDDPDWETVKVSRQAIHLVVDLLDAANEKIAKGEALAVALCEARYLMQDGRRVYGEGLLRGVERKANDALEAWEQGND